MLEKIINLIKLLISILFFRKRKYILSVPSQTRFGNHLYYYLHIFIKRNQGKNYFILYNKDMEYWLNLYPNLKSFVIKNDDIHTCDQLIKTTNFYQNYGVDFHKNQLHNFIDIFLLKESKDELKSKDLIINIRRGDFYNRTNISKYGFNQIEYINEALKTFNICEIKAIGVVSDDQKWCKENLVFLYNYNIEIIFYDNIPAENFLTIINAKKLIITNSTFSFWGAYVNESINKDCQIVAPNFNTSMNTIYQKSSKWKLIDISKF